MERIIKEIKGAVARFKNILENAENPFVRIITHYDTDGITAGAILAKTLQRIDCGFHITIIKQLEKKVLEELIKEFQNQKGIIFFLDLCGNFDLIRNMNTEVFILDHHQIDGSLSLPKNISLVNPSFFSSGKEEISGAGLAYLFSKEFNERNKDLAHLAVIGMVGDVLGHNISKTNNMILQDSDVEVKKGLSILSSTKPINKALEFSTELFIPGVTGNSDGAVQMLRDAGIKFDNARNMASLNQEELSKLVTAIVLRKAEHPAESGKISEDNNEITDSEKSADAIIGNIYTLKFFNRTEDIRDLSSLINACGKLDNGDIAMEFCLGSPKAKEEAEKIYDARKKQIIDGLNYIKNLKSRIEGKNYVIYNCKDMIRDSVIGTILSILAFSFLYPAGNVLIGMAYRDDGKIKVSARITKKSNGINKREINLKEIVNSACESAGIDGESGGHANAAGCLVPVINEEKFINAIQQELQRAN